MTLFTPMPTDDRMLEDCISRMAAGDQTALAQLYDRTRSAVYGFALSILRHPSDAEDVLQDTYLQAWKAAASYSSRGKPMAWLLTIVRHRALDRIREQSRTQTLTLEDWQEHSASPGSVTAEDRLTLNSLLLDLGDQERQIVMLHAVTGLKHREIAKLLELPLSTVLSKYNRALKKLRKAWKEDIPL